MHNYFKIINILIIFLKDLQYSGDNWNQSIVIREFCSIPLEGLIFDNFYFGY